MAHSNEMNTGLDIGANSIKAVAIKPTKTGFELLCAKECRLKSSSTENGFVSDFGELVVGIKNIMDNGNFPSKNIATALKGASTFVRKLSVFCESPAELKETFPWIVDQYVCLDPEEMSIDFEILGEGERYHHVKVLVIGAKKDAVTDIVSVIESAEAVPRIIEPEELSLARLFRAVDSVQADTCVIIHVGFVGSMVVFLTGGTFDFSHEIDFGGKFCKEMLIEELGLPKEEGELIMMDPESHFDPDEAKQTIVDKFCTPFAENIDKAIRLYIHKGGNMPYKIMLSGGGCEIYGLSDALSRRFSVPVEYLDPWKVVEVPDDLKDSLNSSSKYTYNIAIGLAMSEKVY